MATSIFSWLQRFWPFTLLKIDDLELSNRLVQRLAVPDQTKQFIFAINEPSSQTVVYILAVQNLSEQSSLDAEYLIKSVQPDAVMAQVSPSAFPEIHAGDKASDYQVDTVPTSSFGVLKKCFLDKITKGQYENIAGNLVLRDIFGVGFYGHFLAAKKVAEEVNSRFLVLESPYENTGMLDSEANAVMGNQSLLLQSNSLLPTKVGISTSSTLNRFCPIDSSQSQIVKSVAHSLALTMSEPSFSEPICHQNPGDDQQRCSYEVPWFAHTVYSLLADLHNIFVDLPAIGKALVYAQKMLANVNQGEPVDTKIISEVHNFRIAVEGLRIALNTDARRPIYRKENISYASAGFHELPLEEKCHALFAQGLKNQVKNFRSVVAIVDVASLSGIRKHWNTTLPLQIAELASQVIIRNYAGEDGEEVTEGMGKKMLLDKPVVAVGAGATAFLGASSLSKAIHASTFFKFVAYKFPVSLKLSLAHLQRVAAFGLGKMFGPLKLLVPKAAGAGTKISSLKVTASAERIHAVTHSIVTSAERSSLLAMRTAFYEIMRKRNVRPVKLSPWATFGCSMTTCAGLLIYGEGIECAVESVPSVPMIASLGCGLQSLHQASQQVNQYSTKKIQEALQHLMYNVNKSKVQ